MRPCNFQYNTCLQQGEWLVHVYFRLGYIVGATRCDLVFSQINVTFGGSTCQRLVSWCRVSVWRGLLRAYGCDQVRSCNLQYKLQTKFPKCSCNPVCQQDMTLAAARMFQGSLNVEMAGATRCDLVISQTNVTFRGSTFQRLVSPCRRSFLKGLLRTYGCDQVRSCDLQQKRNSEVQRQSCLSTRNVD